LKGRGFSRAVSIEKPASVQECDVRDNFQSDRAAPSTSESPTNKKYFAATPQKPQQIRLSSPKTT
jgi:hypothetical protein